MKLAYLPVIPRQNIEERNDRLLEFKTCAIPETQASHKAEGFLASDLSLVWGLLILLASGERQQRFQRGGQAYVALLSGPKPASRWFCFFLKEALELVHQLPVTGFRDCWTTAEQLSL